MSNMTIIVNEDIATVRTIGRHYGTNNNVLILHVIDWVLASSAEYVGSILDQVKPKTIKLVFATSPLSKQH